MLELFQHEHQPVKRYWLLMKVAPLERLQQMQKGLIYMNSIDYFSNLKGEDGAKVRSDELESTFAQFQTGVVRNNHRVEITLNHPSFGEIDLPKGTNVSMGVPSPKNTFIFCMTCVGEDNKGNIRHLKGNKYHMDRRMKKFGSHTLVINQPAKFFERYSDAINRVDGFFINDYMDGGCGIVDYKKLSKHKGKIGLFIKDKHYDWQREYRFVLGANNSLLNASGALELDIGDISDISSIIETKRLIEEPMTITRGIALLGADGEYHWRKREN
ncbi:TPA: hypothetical protein ACX6QK_003799 [Photobacterium damselae]